MSNLFSYIDEIGGAGGHEGLLEAGQPVMARTVHGYEPLGTPLEEQALVEALTAVLTSEQQVDLAVGNLIEFPVERPSGRWHVLIESRADGVRVRMRGPSPEDDGRAPSRRQPSATPGVDLSTPADSMRGLEINAMDRGDETVVEQGPDPFDEFEDGSDDAGSSGVYEVPSWDQVEAAAAASDADGDLAVEVVEAEAEQTRHPSGEIAPSGRAGSTEEVASQLIDPFAIQDDLDDDFGIEDPFASLDAERRSGSEEVPSQDAVNENSGEFSPFDFGDDDEDDDEAYEDAGAAMEAPSSSADPSSLAHDPDLQGGTQTELEAVDIGPEPVSAPAKPAEPAEEVHTRSPAELGHSSTTTLSVTGGGDVGRWEIVGTGGVEDQMLDSLPSGSACFVLGGARVTVPEGALRLSDGDDVERFIAASRATVPGRFLVLDVEDPSAWLGWVGRRLEASARVLVFTEATTAAGAWRSLVGLQDMVQATRWFSHHELYSLASSDEGLQMGRRVQPGG